jgi:hypothetical protein
MAIELMSHHVCAPEGRRRMNKWQLMEGTILLPVGFFNMERNQPPTLGTCAYFSLIMDYIIWT